MMRRRLRIPGALALLLPMILSGCQSPAASDRPRLVPGVTMTDLTLHSAILGQDVPLRLVAPAAPAAGHPLPVVYVLHGAGEAHTTWTDESGIAALAAQNVLLVMPDGLHTYYVDDALGHRYEDFFFHELIPAVHRRFPAAARDRAHTAIVGNSRGGFAATLYGLKHPETFSYVAGFSSAMDLADRHFRWRTPRESLAYLRVFGPRGSEVRRRNDPYRLAREMEPSTAPFLDLSCGDRDSLLPSNVAFQALLAQRGFAHRWELLPGGHEWTTWNAELPAFEQRLLAHLRAPSR